MLTQVQSGMLQTTAQYYGFKNRIINGAMVIDQRNAGASITPTTTGANTYTLDRWSFQPSQASKVSIQQNAGSVTPPVGFKNYLGATVLSAVTVGAGDYFVLGQGIEGYNIADLGWGTANAKTVTLSFWVYSSLTGSFGGSLTNASGTRSYPYLYSVPVANTWTQISITIPGETTGTWITNNGGGIYLYFSLGMGSTYSGTAGAWVSANYDSATGAVSVVGTSGATFYITGVQLEVGTQATSFDYRPYTTELQLCQRYYWRATGPNDSPIGSGLSISTTAASVYVKLPVTMRIVPAVNAISMVITDAANYNASITSVSLVVGGTDAVRLNVACSGGGMTQYRPALMDQLGSGASYTEFNSEL